MRRKFDTFFGRFIYNKRIAIVEPVSGNLKNKGMDRFTLRGKRKVNTQWQLFSLVHNIEKIAHVGVTKIAKVQLGAHTLPILLVVDTESTSIELLGQVPMNSSLQNRVFLQAR